MFLAALILTGFLLMAVFQIFRNSRMQEIMDEKMKVLPYYLLAASGFILSDILAGGHIVVRLPFDLYLTFLSLQFLTSSTMNDTQAKMAPILILVVEGFLSVMYLSSAFGLLASPDWIGMDRALIAVTIFFNLIYIYSIFMRVREVRLVMKAGNVWSSLTLAVDGVYASVMMTLVSLYLIFQYQEWSRICLSIMMWLEIMALSIRISTDSVFVFWHVQERRIVESMKISSVEISPGSLKGAENYKDIYDRVVALFENDQMYLNSSLTINEVVKVVFTNKLYISRAISQFTGRNFCQFVNYYRVTHAVRLFRENPDLKVTELAEMSGFNSVVSFSMAFRLYMCDSPSDWCRKERGRLLRKKK